jgi:hypothetical protein
MLNNEDMKNLIKYTAWFSVFVLALSYSGTSLMAEQPEVAAEHLTSCTADTIPDYLPKTSTDGILDYRPELKTDFLLLPAAKIENLPELVVLFKEFKSIARKDPGKKTEGNMALGAKSQKYVPSKAELLLNEVGDRIEMIAADEGSEIVRKKLKENKINKRKYKYKKYSFNSMDVEGSGKHFYVDDIRKTILKLY